MKFMWIVAAAAALAMSGCGMAQGQQRPNLHALGLRATDLLPHSTMDFAHYWTNAKAARRDRVPVALYNRHGRVLSYQDSFARNMMNGISVTWLLHADSEITAYRDTSGAIWYYNDLHSAMRKAYVTSTNNLGANAGQTGVHVHYHSLAIPSIGDRSAAFTVDSGGDEVAFTTRVVIFQQGRDVVLLRIRGLIDQTLVSKVVAVARKVDARTKTAS